MRQSVNFQYNFKRAHDRGLNFIKTFLKSWSCFRSQANTLVAPSLTKCQGRDWCQIISGSFIPDYLDIIPADKLSQFRHGRARSGHYLPYCFLEQKLMNAGIDDRQTVGREFRRTTNQLPRIRTLEFGFRKLNPSQLNRIDENGYFDDLKVIIKRNTSQTIPLKKTK